MKTREEMFTLALEGKIPVFKIEDYENLRGHTIQTTHIGYNGQTSTEIIVVGDLVSEWDLARNKPMDGFANRQEYWASYMTPKKIQERKETLVMTDFNGVETFIKKYPNNNIFSVGEYDCYFIILEN